jgi:cobalt-precorrin-5B (C1)-methyltransferase
MIANFVGFALDYLKQKLNGGEHALKTLILAGHPGKLAKVIDGHWNTHSKESPVAVSSILRVAAGLLPEKPELNQAITVEGLIQISQAGKFSDLLFDEVAKVISQTVSRHIGEILDVDVYLADFNENIVGRFETRMRP